MPKKVRCIKDFACFHAGMVYCVGNFSCISGKWFRRIYDVYLGEEPSGACREVLDIDLRENFEVIENN